MSDVTNIRVAIFEATQMSCDLMSRVLTEPSHHIEVVWTGVSSELRDDTFLQNANVALISPTLREGNLSGFTLLHRLSKSHRDLNCILLLDQDNRDLVIEAFRSGAVGVCQRDQPYEQLLKCITCVHDGQVWASSQQMRYVLEALSGGLPAMMFDNQGQGLLSKREEEIVSKVAEGLKNREIGELLYVSEHTVKNHLFRIFGRLGISSRAELILYAYGHKLSVDSKTGTDYYRKR
ncbi:MULTISPECIES: response regulator transcription factor [Acidobacteriaceae]|uniref:helix-turn-helix transcriptional regulator n=1 Tax=Acidobacteriaceae TaxID=204434 RepID=UPI00131CED4C|nr:MULTISPECIES: response regulator transcription factor [Acidobacteriaceae]MDW5265936.1 response regulator transcription factor [Edaphobacter sp.]